MCRAETETADVRCLMFHGVLTGSAVPSAVWPISLTVNHGAGSTRHHCPATSRAGAHRRKCADRINPQKRTRPPRPGHQPKIAKHDRLVAQNHLRAVPTNKCWFAPISCRRVRPTVPGNRHWRLAMSRRLSAITATCTFVLAGTALDGGPTQPDSWASNRPPHGARPMRRAVRPESRNWSTGERKGDGG